ncbi:anhydro-N-acetylmuramic acid kinase [Pantanalinema sp. GBBB05]|uniref:anhydro-N-acetylmuramic acid kinase n=1 Tax=Pantanalinema sp. GBBB05 TaxID=2604139 RepID=UPI001DD7B07F|nr:anhydro-N-acetylmuramic acid kinase [Pantanalinema sp. GBBB05]
MVYVIGLISGTSVDGIDAGLVEISGGQDDLRIDLVAGATYPYPAHLRERILAVCAGAALSVAELAELDDEIAQQFAQAAIALQAGHPVANLIGSHGQTVFHRPPDKTGAMGRWGDRSALGYSLQLGRGEAIAYLTGIPTVSNFRQADIAVGGEGAPLVPAVDLALLTHPTYSRCVQNLGGIGNVAYLPAKGSRDGEGREDKEAQRSRFVLGWDTGPGNVLIDLAVQQLSGGAQTYDRDGAWAATGTPCQELVDQWLQHPFFHQLPPKSTGRELFGVAYLHQCWTEAEARSLSAADFLATLTELTVASISHSYRTFLPQLPDQVLLCGGGSKNRYLKHRLQATLGEVSVLTTDDVGVNADFKEAIAFAVLAYWRQQGIPGNLPEVTGATMPMLLGEIHGMTFSPSVIA